MEPVLKKFCARPPRFLELDTRSYRSICRRTYRIKFAFFKFLWNLFPAWAENNPFLYSQIKPSVLFALEEISFICWDYWRVLVRVMPKSLISLTVASGDPLRWYSRFLEFSSQRYSRPCIWVCWDTFLRYHSRLRAALGLVEMKSYPMVFNHLKQLRIVCKCGNFRVIFNTLRNVVYIDKEKRRVQYWVLQNTGQDF